MGWRSSGVVLLSWLSLPLVARAEPEAWSGSVNVGVTLAQGNAESLYTSAGLEFSGVFDGWEVLGSLYGLYGEDNGETSAERLEALLQLNRDVSGSVYVGISGEHLYDPLAGVDYRFGITPVVGVRLVDGDRFKMRFEIGPGYVWEDREDKVREYPSLRAHEKLTFDPTEDLRFFQSLTAVTESADLGNYVLTAEAGVEFRVNRHWATRLAAKGIFYGESRGRENGDLLFTAGLGYGYTPGDDGAPDPETVHEDKTRRKKWVITGLLGGRYSDGNSDAGAVTVGLYIKRERSDDQIGFGANGTYGERDGERSAQSLAVEAYYQEWVTSRAFAGGRLDGDHDRSAELDWRVGFTPYYGYAFVREERVTLSLEAGPSYVSERKRGRSDDYLGAYLGAKAEAKIGSDTRLYAEVEWLQDTGDWDTYVITSEIGIDQELSEKITLKLILRDQYDSAPVAGTKKNDVQLISALSVSF